MTSQSTVNLQRCREEALLNYGTAYIFERRTRKFQRRIRLLTFCSLGPPLFVGAMVLSFNYYPAIFDGVLKAAGLIALIQLVVSLWALVNHWEHELDISVEAKLANYRLADQFNDLRQSFEAENWQHQFELLMAENNQRSEQDRKVAISDKEKRMGMRAGLRQFNQECAHCGKIPYSMEPTDCPVCGKF